MQYICNEFILILSCLATCVVCNATSSTLPSWHDTNDGSTTYQCISSDNLTTNSPTTALHLQVLIPLTGDLHITVSALGVVPVAIERVKQNVNGEQANQLKCTVLLPYCASHFI